MRLFLTAIIACCAISVLAAPLSTQHKTLKPSKDTFYTASNSFESKPQGSSPYLIAYDNAGVRSFTLIAFDLPQEVIGNSSRVAKCTMTLGKFAFPPTGSVNIFLTATSAGWDEKTVSGLNAPAVMGETVQIVVTDTLVPITFDSTYLCSVAASSGGGSMSVRLDSPQALYSTASRENGGQASLLIEY
ncbi:hypothetical protein DL89DRAFT_266069 [Linderina pennispora]|uniref:Carbohydrate-binding module family 96 domain-containing protein n=1 Tax=Linderina pennispora TaxID=61395 RepID=A0A1Y1WG91_9FUNG|nr:uncharacterized protein DL89DRAFT_266069 [Linderina pennispora]ORX72492.1 hypothetical protein DL89DRAFT_266069 [Linderina pennispora]